jgi:hypothetical protein
VAQHFKDKEAEKTVRRRIAEGKLPIIRTGRLVRIHPKYAHLDL